MHLAAHGRRRERAAGLQIQIDLSRGLRIGRDRLDKREVHIALGGEIHWRRALEWNHSVQVEIRAGALDDGLLDSDYSGSIADTDGPIVGNLKILVLGMHRGNLHASVKTLRLL